MVSAKVQGGDISGTIVEAMAIRKISGRVVHVTMT